jgi:tRNA1Val (adenine37-N6)-methyltransferase
MPNNYFQFKEFIIHQDKCSMKVCTDACLFGSTLPAATKGGEIRTVLDIGTGTGLLSLMYAQRNLNAEIDAVEIEENAYQQAKENFAASKWNSRLNIFHADVKQFVKDKKYDLIISNPPFYENELISNEKNKNLAKHDEGLTLKDLIQVIRNNLAVTGCFAILLPYYRIQYFENIAAKNNFILTEKILVRQTSLHNFFRGILFFSNAKSDIVIKEVSIKGNSGNYTQEFIGLLKEYYLKL